MLIFLASPKGTKTGTTLNKGKWPMVNYTPNLSKKDSFMKEEVCVEDIMNKSYPAFKEDESILKAVEILLNQKLSGAPVLDGEGKVVGFLSEKDCLKIATEMKYYNNLPGKISNYMSGEVTTLSVGAGIFTAIELFIKYPFHCYPVTDEGKLVGVLERRSLLREVNHMGQTNWAEQN